MDFLAMGQPSSPYILVYQWTSAGFGTTVAAPTTTPEGQVGAVDFTSQGDMIFMGMNTSPYLAGYRFGRNGFGVRLANPSTLPPDTVNALDVHPTDGAIVVALNSTPFVSAYRLSSSGFGTKYSNPGTLPAASPAANGVRFSPTGGGVAVSHGGGQSVSAYKFTVASGFGTKFTDPSSSVGGQGRGIDFSPDGTKMVLTGDSTSGNQLGIFTWSDTAGMSASPGLYSIGGSSYAMRCAPTGDGIVVGVNNSPWMVGYSYSGTVISTPGTNPGGNVTAVAFSKYGDTVAVSAAYTPLIDAYQWNAGIGTRYSNPSTLPTQYSYGLSFGWVKDAYLQMLL